MGAITAQVRQAGVDVWGTIGDTAEIQFLDPAPQEHASGAVQRVAWLAVDCGENAQLAEDDHHLQRAFTL